MVKALSRGRQVKARALESSAILVALMVAGPAFAQCSPDPTQANATTICTGTDSNGLVVTTSGGTVEVAAGASVTNSGAPAIRHAIPVTNSSYAYSTLTIGGRVDGGSQTGVQLLRQSINNNYSSLNVTMTVAAGGSVNGANGVVIGQTGAGYGSTTASIDNGGTITGTGTGTNGYALLSTDPSYAGFQSITNRAGGTIGAISGPVGTLTNAGTIDGGARSAVDWGTVTNNSVYGYSSTNSGTIRSGGTGATLSNIRSTTLTNSGTIGNSGTGAAITGTSLTLINQAGGFISTAGTIAVQIQDSGTLTNAGTINGDVLLAGRANYFYANSVDNSTGTINGNLSLGAGSDTLTVGYADGAIRTGVTGTIDGGAGTNRLRIRFTNDATLASAPVLPNGFQQMILSPDAGKTATLGSGFRSADTLRIGGSGTVISNATLSGAGTLLTDDGNANEKPIIVNAGTIIGTPGSTNGWPASAVQLYQAQRFENSGTITAGGNAVLFNAQGMFVNSGTITAGGTGVEGGSGGFANSGTIRSTNGIGAILSGSSGTNWTNSGRIEGTTAGLRLSSRLTNTGTITGTGSGIMLWSYGEIVNQAGGVITGGTNAIGQGGGFSSAFNARIANAGTINGDVTFGRSGFGSSNGNIYQALPGGVLNGNLLLNNGDTFVTELTGSGSGRYAGINGSVTGTGAYLRYRVRTDTSTSLIDDTAFASFGYDVRDKATLTVTGATSSRRLQLAGQGTVDLTADISPTNGPAISTTSLVAVPGEEYPNNLANALTIISRGTLSLTISDQNSYASAVVLDRNDDFTNAGTITVRDLRPQGYGPIAGIAGGRVVTNTGRIVQADDGRAAMGVTDVQSLVNSGTIQVAGVAASMGYSYDSGRPSIDNSGLIASTGGTAIMQSYGVSGFIRNLAGGTITGGVGKFAIQVGRAQLTNAGTINGDVDLGHETYGRSYSSSTYTAAGGTLNGNLRFGDGDDVLVVTDGQLGITGTVDGGAGRNTYRHALTRSGTVTLGNGTMTGFELEDVQAIGADTLVTVQATGARDTLNLIGDGQIVNAVNVDGLVTLGQRDPWTYAPISTLGGFTNQATVASRVEGAVTRFANSGTIGDATAARTAVYLTTTRFENSGAILNDGMDPAVELSTADESITAINSGTITGGLDVSLIRYVAPGAPETPQPQPFQITVSNSGTITSTADHGAVYLAVEDYRATGGTIRLDNSGTLDASGPAGAGAQIGFYGPIPATTPQTITVDNSGTIRANGGGVTNSGVYYPGGSWSQPVEYIVTAPASGVHVFGNGDATATITNAATGVIEATGEKSVAILASGAALDLTNAGTIRGGADTVLGEGDLFALALDTSNLAGAIQSIGTTDDRIVNTGTIIGSIALDAGNDRIENYGRIEGNVFLGAGDDSFLHRASAVLVGTVDGGEGSDSLIIDATGGGTVNGDQFVHFERFSQTGQGDVTYAGAFRFDTLGVAGGSVTVAAGQTLTSTGATTITGTDANETVTNSGTIAGSVALGAGNDRFVNAGLVQGAVALGDGDDGFVEGAGSSVAGGVDGGAGTNLYTALLSGDRAGLGQRSNFQQLAVTGNGTLSLTLDQGFDTVALAGTGLNLTLAGNRVGAVTGSDAAEQLRVDGDIAGVALGAGDDLLALGATNAAGRYDGGAGNDTLRFTANAPVVLSGLATGFENVALTGNALLVTGSLGSQGAPLGFGDGDLSLTIAPGATLAGVIDLGAGNDALRFAAGAILQGSVAGGAGNDSATLEMAGDRTLAAGTLTGFETLATEGSGTLSLTGTQSYAQVNAATDLTIAAGGSLTTGQVAFTGGNQRLTIAGTFAGAVDGGAGSDSIAVSGGTASAPVAFTNIANVEALAMTGGYATLSGQAAFGAVDMTGGRLVGLAGSTMAAPQFLVRQGATFGSAGTVNGNVTVAGILSPGASPGTMTVNGNVALNGGSLSYFELTPTVSDKLVVNGALTIADGSTLQIVSSGALRPGTSYDLIVASGGISGSYGNVVKPSDLFGFIVQRADRIQLLGQFLGDARFSPQVSRSIDYANATLAKQPATSTLFAALPSLLTASGASSPRGFAQISPEAYASATQIGVDNALGLVQAARGPAFATTREDAGAFTFGQTVGQWHTLGADAEQGTSAARTRGYGFLGGVGYGDRQWMIGAFGGWLDTRQQVAPLAASTRADGVVAGVHGRYAMPNGFGFGASIVYDGAQARTTRALPGTASAFGRYNLHSWVSDLSVHYAAELAEGWALTPRAGLTYLRTTRAGANETGGSPFALTVARDRQVAGFADAGVTFGRSDASDAPFRPFVTLGARYQIEGNRAVALGGYAGGGLGLVALGAARAPLVGTATGGVAYRFANGMDLYATGSAQTGRDDHQETISAGLRLRF